MKRKEKNDLLKRMASVLDLTLVKSGQVLPKEISAEIVGLLRECDEQMPHFVASAPRQYHKLLADGKLDLSVTEKR